MKLKIEYIPKEELKPYANNAKIHTEEQIEQIKKSIEEFGFNDPIAIWKDNEIIEGHGRLLAVMEMDDIEQVPIIRLDELTDEQRRAYTLAHNKLTINTEFNQEILSLELEEIANIDMTGFGFEPMSRDNEDENIVEVEIPDIPEEAKTKYGDVWVLGCHRVMCGDATSKADVLRLCDGVKMQLVATDPPYNINYEGAGNTRDRGSKKIKNDNLTEKDFYSFLLKAFNAYYSVAEDGATLYTFYKETGNGVFMQVLADTGFDFKQELVWVKNQLVLGGGKYQNMYEPCLMAGKGKIKTWNGGRKQTTVIESTDLMTDDELRDTIKTLLDEQTPDVIRVKKNTINDLHPTMKPIRLMAKIIKNSTNVGHNVIDLFGGSGSTLIACEQIKRNAYVMEYEPKYVDVIVKRWEDFTGGKAEKINDMDTNDC